MDIEIDPIVGEWYQHLDKGQRFLIVAFDEDEGLIETQHFDGDIEEIPLDAWYQQDIQLIEPPENWGGAMDIGTKDDYGTEITDTDISDWSEPLQEFKSQSEGLNEGQSEESSWE